MPHRHEFGPFSFDAPGAWPRREILVFVDPARGASPVPSVVVTRDQREPSEPLSAYAWRRLVEISRNAPERRLVEGQPTRLGGQSAFRASMQWDSENGVVREMLAWVDDGEQGVLVATCTMLAGDASEPFEHMLSSLSVGMAATLSSTTPGGPRSVTPPPLAMLPTVPIPGPRRVRP